MFAIIHVMAHEHMGLLGDFEVIHLPWNSSRCPLDVSSILVLAGNSLPGLVSQSWDFEVVAELDSGTKADVHLDRGSILQNARSAVIEKSGTCCTQMGEEMALQPNAN